MAGLAASLFTPSLGVSQDVQEVLLRVELVLESRDPSVDRQAVMNAVNEAQREAHGRALTVLHVVVPVGGDAEIHVYDLSDEEPGASESFVIPRGGARWLSEALAEDVARRLVHVRAPADALLLSWDGSRRIEARPGLVEWHVLRVEDATNLSAPPSAVTLLVSWDGTRALEARPGLVAWHVSRVESATHLSPPPRVDALLISWDGTAAIEARSGLVEWHVTHVEDD
ncbi:MAG: hypothetical protein ACI9KE_004257 [Polyangiales bacterium]|jgi:hypothetical protein